TRSTTWGPIPRIRSTIPTMRRRWRGPSSTGAPTGASSCAAPGPGPASPPTSWSASAPAWPTTRTRRVRWWSTTTSTSSVSGPASSARRSPRISSRRSSRRGSPGTTATCAVSRRYGPSSSRASAFDSAGRDRSQGVQATHANLTGSAAEVLVLAVEHDVGGRGHDAESECDGVLGVVHHRRHLPVLPLQPRLRREVGTAGVGEDRGGVHVDTLGEPAVGQPVVDHGDLGLAVGAPVSEEDVDLGSSVGFDSDFVAVPVGPDHGGGGHPDGRVPGVGVLYGGKGGAGDGGSAEAGGLIGRLLPRDGPGEPDDQGQADDTADDPHQVLVHSSFAFT